MTRDIEGRSPVARRRRRPASLLAASLIAGTFSYGLGSRQAGEQLVLGSRTLVPRYGRVPGRNLAGTEPRGARMDDVDLRQADLREAVFSDAFLRRARL